MNEGIKEILESGLLEEYIAGLLDEEQKSRVEQALAQHPELRAEYQQLQQVLETFASSIAVKPPSGLKRRIVHSLSESSRKPNNLFNRNWSIAASVAAIILLGTSLALGIANRNLNDDKQLLTSNLEQISEQYDIQNSKLELFAGAMGFLKNPNTGKYVLSGNQLAPGLQTVAYWNPVDQQSYLDILNLPELPDRQCFQLWADVEGEMVSLGVISSLEEDLVPLPFLTNAASLNITIEPEGGSAHPHVDKLVASLSI